MTSAEQPQDEGPVFMDAYDFVAQQSDPPAPLWGTPKMTVFAQGGLAILAGRPGTGKTTFVIDLACHLAAGLAYPPTSEAANGTGPSPLAVARPLRIALIENEGPLELFRDKLRDKLDRFPHRLTSGGGYLGVQVWRWGGFSFADNRALVKAKDELDQLNVDLVIGDPLTMLGMKGVGSPEDTRDFVNHLKFLGLGTTRAFLLIHHFRERSERHEDELQRLSGAWGGHLDTLVTIAAMGTADQARLAFPKIRWAREPTPKPIILGRVFQTGSFESIGMEDDVSILEPVLADKLQELRDTNAGKKGRGWVTHTDLAQHAERRKTDVRRCLEGASHLFAVRTGEDARDLGARKTAVLWGLRTWDDAPPPPAPKVPTNPPEEQNDLGF